MFILDVSVGVSVRFITSAIGFIWLLLFGRYFMSFTFVVVELESEVARRRPSARHSCIWSVVLCRAAAGRRSTSRGAPARRHVPRMPTGLSSFYSRHYSTQTLKILGSWMYALAYVNCDSFFVSFLWSERRWAAAPATAPRRRLASISSSSAYFRYYCLTRSYRFNTYCCLDINTSWRYRGRAPHRARRATLRQRRYRSLSYRHHSLSLH